MEGKTQPFARAIKPPKARTGYSGSLYAQILAALTFGTSFFASLLSLLSFTFSSSSESFFAWRSTWEADLSMPASDTDEADGVPLEPPIPTSPRYLPPGISMSLSCVPSSSTTEPSAPPPPARPPAASFEPRTTILSAPRTVVSLCAMTMVVLLPWAPATRSSSAACTRRSFSVSSAEVASSRMRIGGLRSAALAIATRCFCPPESLLFLPPTTVSYPSGNVAMKSCAEAARAADSISAIGTSVACLTPARPTAMFMPMLALKRSGSCDTTPMADLRLSMRSLVMSTPSRVMVPALGS
mmetsp:Transcript_7986/g.22102  ORF Transcript_7986/g.22102 Transcript_7986/m.22102 type:complete len:298 (+) Transcript_7986:3151-4044(+)